MMMMMMNPKIYREKIDKQSEGEMDLLRSKVDTIAFRF